MRGELFQELTHTRNPEEQPEGVEHHTLFPGGVGKGVRLMLWHSGEVETLGEAVAGMLPGWAPSRSLSKLL